MWIRLKDKKEAQINVDKLNDALNSIDRPFKIYQVGHAVSDDNGESIKNYNQWYHDAPTQEIAERYGIDYNVLVNGVYLDDVMTTDPSYYIYSQVEELEQTYAYMTLWGNEYYEWIKADYTLRLMTLYFDNKQQILNIQNYMKDVTDLLRSGDLLDAYTLLQTKTPQPSNKLTQEMLDQYSLDALTFLQNNHPLL